MDRNEDFYNKVKADEGVKFVKSKIAKIEGSGDKLVLEGEDTASGKKFKAEHDLVVLATGMQPNSSIQKIPGDAKYDEYGFALASGAVFPVGTTKTPNPVVACNQDATSAALKAIQAARR